MYDDVLSNNIMPSCVVILLILCACRAKKYRNSEESLDLGIRPETISERVNEWWTLRRLNRDIRAFQHDFTIADYKRVVLGRSMKRHDAISNNPLLEEPTLNQRRLINIFTQFDPQIKTKDGWHESSDIWSQRFWTACVKLADYIKEQPVKDVEFHHLARLIGSWRQFVKIESNLHNGRTKLTPETLAFGRLNTFGGVLTVIGGRYKNLWVVPGTGQTIWDYMRDYIGGHYKSKKRKWEYEPDGMLGIRVYAELTEHRIFFEIQQGLSARIPTVSYVYDRGGPLAWIARGSQTNVEMRQLMSSFIQRIIAASNDDRVDLEEYLRLVGSLHWLVSSTSPFDRGSAALADVLTASLLLLKGYVWQGWAEGISADVSALCIQNLTEYQYRFGTLMRHMPIRMFAPDETSTKTA